MGKFFGEFTIYLLEFFHHHEFINIGMSFMKVSRFVCDVKVSSVGLVTTSQATKSATTGHPIFPVHQVRSIY